MAITDPVTGFTYPPAWVAACSDRAALDLVRSGLAILASDGTVLRRGFTTGTTAAAACKASVISLREARVEVVHVAIPCGLRVSVPVEAEDGEASARKFAGDYPDDATAGMEFRARASTGGDGAILVAGEGIGRFARDTPRHAAGEPAISHPALQCILGAIREGMAEIGSAGAEVVLSAPLGAAVAAGTLNPRVGVAGGISVLGTTGLVEPWDDHLTASVLERVAGADRVVLTTGRTGLRYSRMLFPGHVAVLVGARMEEAIGKARGPVVLCGLPGLILRFLSPRILDGTGCATVEELASGPQFAPRLEEAFALCRERFPGLRVVIVSREGSVLGDSG